MDYLYTEKLCDYLLMSQGNLLALIKPEIVYYVSAASERLNCLRQGS